MLARLYKAMTAACVHCNVYW